MPLFASCGALGEGLKAASFTRVVLEEPLPLERDLRPWLEELGASLDLGGCGLPLQRYYWEHPERLSRSPDERTEPGQLGPPLFWRIPWFRQGAVFSLLDLLGASAVDMSRSTR